MQQLNATKKGAVTGVAMIALTLALFYARQPFDSPAQYLVYLLYAAGIIWTLYDFSKSEENNNKFATFFLQGFKCFMVITLLMVIFTYVFNKMHPEFKDEMAKAYREELVKKGNSTPAEIADNIKKMNQYYLTMLISGAIFGYLLIGGAITAAASLLFMKRK
jgi:4-hydroxybenzoate polyprenyltransferase